MTRTRTAAYVDALGPTSSVQIGELPVPELGPFDVLIEVQAVVANPVDTYVRSGRYVTPVPLPFILGRDLVGQVADVGSAVTSLQPGDSVWCNSLGHEGRQGSFTDLAVAPADRVYRLPAGVDPETAVAVAHPAITAYLGWFVHAGLRPEWTVVVGGGAGNVGTAAIQMAARAGAHVIATARAEHADRCRSAGAATVLDYRSPDLADAVRDAAPHGAHVYWDTSGTNDMVLAATVLTLGGRILVTASRAPSITVAFSPLYTRDIVIDGFALSRTSAAELANGAELINQMLAAGQLTARIADRLPLAAAPDVHERLEAGGVDGRILLTT